MGEEAGATPPEAAAAAAAAPLFPPAAAAAAAAALYTDTWGVAQEMDVKTDTCLLHIETSVVESIHPRLCRIERDLTIALIFEQRDNEHGLNNCILDVLSGDDRLNVLRMKQQPPNLDQAAEERLELRSHPQLPAAAAAAAAAAEPALKAQHSKHHQNFSLHLVPGSFWRRAQTCKPYSVIETTALLLFAGFFESFECNTHGSIYTMTNAAQIRYIECGRCHTRMKQQQPQQPHPLQSWQCTLRVQE